MIFEEVTPVVLLCSFRGRDDGEVCGDVMVMMVRCVVMSVSVCRRWRGLITAGLSRPSCSVNVHFSLNFGQSGNWVTHPATLPAHDRHKEISTLLINISRN